MAQTSCHLEETNPKRTIVNGYVLYVGEEIGSPGSVIHLGDLALRLNSDHSEDDDIIAEAKQRRLNRAGSNERVIADTAYQYDIKGPGFPAKQGSLRLIGGETSTGVDKYTICGQEVSVSITVQGNRAFWVVSSF